MRRRSLHGDCRIAPTNRAFTMLELQVALGVLAIGLLGLGSLMIRQSRQVARLESWCVPDRTYYVVAQSNPWMRALNAPADFNAAAGQGPWAPPVTGRKTYVITLVSQARTSNAACLSAVVTATKK